jgi:hypothetical protein
MTQKSYTAEDEEFVRFVRTTNTIQKTAQLSGLSESTVKRILAKPVTELRPDENRHGSQRPDEISELKSMIEKQNKTIARLMEMVAPRPDYEDEQPVRKLVLGKKL